MLFVLVPTLSYGLNGSSAVLVFGHIFIKRNGIPLSLSIARLVLLSYICLISKTNSPCLSCWVSAPVLASVQLSYSRGWHSTSGPTRGMHSTKNTPPCPLLYFTQSIPGFFFSVLCQQLHSGHSSVLWPLPCLSFLVLCTDDEIDASYSKISPGSCLSTWLCSIRFPLPYCEK